MLYSKIKGLKPIDLNFVLISNAKSYEDDFEGKIFLLNSCYEIIRAKLYNKDTKVEPELPFEFPVGIKPFSGGLHSRPEGFKPYVIGTVGRCALTVPFSEILPYTMGELPNYIAYKKSVGPFPAAQIEEALEEGIAHILMEKNELGVPNADKYEKYLLTGFESKRYMYANRAIKFIKKVGMQNAFDLFAESPVKFKSELEKI